MAAKKKNGRGTSKAPRRKTKGLVKPAGATRQQEVRSITEARRESGKPKKANARSYSQSTLKLLFALSLNHCAFPKCTNPVVAAGTEYSDPAVLGHICHIYAAKDNGPRGRLDLTLKERSAFENLILMCGVHHPLVDKQWESYPAGMLKEWKEKHEAKATAGTPEALKLNDEIGKLAFFSAVSDAEIEKELKRLRQSRLLVGFDTSQAAIILAGRVERADYSGGSANTRARALAWCARLLSQDKTSLARATQLVTASRALAATPEATIAQAFIDAETDLGQALGALARLDTNHSRSAAFRIVRAKKGAKGALEWAASCGMTVEKFDAEGVLTLIHTEMEAGRWEHARCHVDLVTDADCHRPAYWSQGVIGI